MTFENPANQYRETASAPWAWTLLFGCFYFAAKGIWRHAIIGFFAAIFTVGISWLIYPFLAGGIVRADYLRRGWREVT